MKKIYFTLFLLSLAGSLTAHADTKNVAHANSFTPLDKIVAVVNRDPITLSEVNKEIDHIKKQLEHTQQPLPPAGELRKNVLDMLIGKKLQMQLCLSTGTKVTDEELEGAIQNVAKNNKLSMAQLKEAIKQTGLSYDEYHQQVHDQLLLQKLQQEQIGKNIAFTPEDVKKFMRENKDKFSRYSAYQVVDVVLPIATGATASQQAQIKKQANDLVKQLQAHKDLDAVLKNFPTAEKNDLGWRELPGYPTLFQAKIAGMRPNNISSPIQAPNGLHILKLIAGKGETPQPTEREIKNIVYQQKMGAAAKEWVEKLRKDAYVQIMP